MPRPMAAAGRPGRSALEALRRWRGLPPTFTKDLHGDRNHGQHDDDQHDDVDVAVDIGHGGPEEVSGPGHTDDPPDPAGDVIEEEAPVEHLAHAGNDRREGPD